MRFSPALESKVMQITAFCLVGLKDMLALYLTKKGSTALETVSKSYEVPKFKALLSWALSWALNGLRLVGVAGR